MIKYLPELHLETIMRSGQCFRLIRQISGDVLHTDLNDVSTKTEVYRLIAYGRVLYIGDLGSGYYDFHCTEEEYAGIWTAYFDLDEDYGKYCECVDEEDGFLAAAVRHGRGMRILRQEPWETLVSFIMSQQKNIPAIRKAIEVLCERYGESLAKLGGPPLYCFPTPQRLKEAGIEELKSCGLGFRAKYVYDAARRVADGELDLQSLENLGNEEMGAALKNVFGVGDKIAACVMLFAYHRLDVFPVDVWIDRVVKERYGGAFPFDKYGSVAGVLQQYMFYYALSGGLSREK